MIDVKSIDNENDLRLNQEIIKNTNIFEMSYHLVV